VSGPEPTQPWDDAVLAAALFAVDPRGTGGISVRALAGPVRERWLTTLLASLPPEAPVRRVPLHIGEDRLLGGLDLAPTLQAGRPVVQRGVLATADGGVVLLAMAERLSPTTAALIGAALDRGAVALERDGLAELLPARIGVVALDEGIDADERPPSGLVDRLAFHLDLGPCTIRDAGATEPAHPDVLAAARARLASVQVGEAELTALCSTAAALGIGSLRAPLLALRVALAAAALAGRLEVVEADLEVAARLVLAPRATMLPAPPDAEEPENPEPEPPEDEPEDSSDPPPPDLDQPLEDLVLAAAQAAIPPGLLAELRAGAGPRSRAPSAGRVGALRETRRRGRPAGSRRGEPRRGARLDVVETLRTAAPWQPLRRRSRQVETAGPAPARVEVRADDFRIIRFKQRAQTTTIFVVDASGSAALHRLAEAKGAVELLLAECYVRRDEVALLAFRGQGADLLLPPTRSLVRAKRSLAGLPGGGGTPLATAIEAAAALADTIRRRGDTPVVVLLTDGRANIARDGRHDRPQAEADAQVAARMIRAAGLTTIVVDTSPRPQPRVRTLAAELGGRYVPLPYADAAALSQAVRTS
jgi:magnesium chelatase subunit D